MSMNQNGMETYMMKTTKQHLIIFMTLVVCLLGIAGEVLATSCTLKAGTGGQVRYRVKSSASGASYGTWSGYAASHTINTTNGYTVQIQSSVSNGYTWSKWTGYTTGLSSTTAQNPTFSMANGFSGKTITASFTENSLTIGSLVNNLTYTLTTVTSANGSGNVFKVTCSNTSSEFHNKTYCYINHIDTGTSDTGTETIQFNNTATILVKGYIRVQSANATLKLQNGNNSIVTLKKHGREGNFIYSSAGKLQILGNSSKGAPFIIDGGAVFPTAGDARSLYVEEAGGFTNHGGDGVLIYATGGALVMKNTILQNNYHFGGASGINAYNTADTYPEFNLENVTIQGCWAQHGSGVYISGADQHGTQADGAILKNVTIQKCYATGNPTSQDPGGGTIRTNGGGRTRLTIDGGEICYNRSGNPSTGGYGGGVYWNACGKPETRITLKNNVKIHHNDALPPNAAATTKSWAGGIMIESRMTIESAEIYNNGAKLGGGIYMCSYGGSAAEFDGIGFDLTVSEGVKIYNNYATEIGGGAYLAINKSPDLGYDPDGNAVDAVFKFTLDGGEVSGNHAPLGGGVAIMDKAPKKVKYCKWRVDHTSATTVQTLVTSGEYKPQIKISSGSIHDNYTDGGDNCGAGIYVRKYIDDEVLNGTTLMSGSNTISTGFSYADVGGAGTVEFTATGGLIYGNGMNNGTVKTAKGGAFYITDEMGSASPYLSECNVKVSGTANIYQNQATTHGGAFFVNNGVFSMTGGTIGGSTANANKVTDSNSKGGGFYITGAYSNVSISGGSVTYNTATATGGLGGGFYVDNSSSTGTSITGSAKVTNNQATSGGGAYINEGTLTVNGSNVEIKSNTATAGNGGGIFANGGTVTLTAGSIANNTATGSGTTGLGGGIYSKGALTIQGATIGGSATTAKNSAYDGAGVYVAGGTVSHTLGSVRFNEASHNGGGIYSTGGTVTIDGSDALVADNQAAEQGGGIWAGGTVNLENGLIQRNKATSTTAGKGGGVYVNNSTFKMTGGTIGGTTTSDANTVPFQGGGVYITGANAKVQVQGGTISYNTATGANGDGGGVYVASTHADGTSVSNSSNITNNTANHDGGGLYVANGKLTVDASTISSNTATNGSGGGIYAVGTVTITGGTISSNHADKTGDDCGLGGGIYAEAGSNTITIESGSSITGNTAQHGAGLYAASGTVDVKTNSTITSNVASQNGGGIYANGGTVNVSATTTTTEILKQNTAVNGGGIYANGGTVNFSNGVIKGNYASHWGGGLYIPATGKLTLKGTATITGNRVPAGMQGGGVYLAGVVEVGSASKANTDVLKVEDNYADDADATVTNDNRNNIYLPNPVATPASSSNPHVDVITIFNTGIDTNSSSVGFSVPRNFVPVIYCSDASYLAGLVDSDGVLQGSYIFEDSHKYTAYYHSYAPYDPNHIYLSSGTWVNHVTAQPATGFSVDENGDVTISNEEGLAWLISYVNGLNDVQGGAHAMAGKTVSLTADVNMGDYAWVPIGSMLHADAFKGTFDGNGHTISNIYCMYLGNQVTGQNLGMFGVANDNAIIKNVFLEDAEYTTLDQTTGSPYVGGLVETLGGSAKIYNCGVDAKLESFATGSVIGGLVGKMEGGEIHSAFAVAEMTGYTMGGLVGQLTAGNLYNSFANPQFNYSGPYTDPEDPDTEINLYVGGLVAENGGSVQNCYVRLERNQSLGSALFGMLAGTNTFTIGTTSYNGTIAHSYAPDDASTQFNHSYTYLYNGIITGLSDCDLYKKVDASYKYNRPNDNKIGSTDETLTEKLNEWVSGQHDEHPEYAYWKRATAGNYTTGSGNINDDYPIHKMVGLSNAASPDGLFIEYKYSLDAMLTKYNNLEDGGTVWVYDSPLSAMTASGGTPSYESVSVNNAAKVKLYIDEEASLLQYYNANSASDNNTLTAYTSQTLPGSPRSWHFLSSSLSNSGIGFNYGQSALFNWEPNPCHVTISNDDDAALFPSDLPMSGGYADVARIDLYAFYEPEYHWINLKRNSNSHWHMNATTLPISYTNETTLTPGKGYLVSIDQDQLLQNKGTLNNGKVSIDLNYTPANAWAGLLGYNLIGNPYQSYLDFNAFVTYTPNAGLWYDNSKGADMEPTYAVYDASMGGYIQYKKGSSRGSKSATGILNMHQGFMIRVASAGKSAHFTNDMRTNEGNGVSFRGEQPAYPLINLTVRDDEGVNDFAVLELGRDRDEGAEKLRANDSKGWLYLHHGSENYGILFRSEVDDYQPLWFEADEAGSYTLSWETANAEFEALTLIDNITGVVTDMLAHDRYTFEATPEQYASRFKIVIGDYKDIEENEAPEPVEGPTFAYVNNGNIVLTGLEPQGGVSLQIIDMTGRVILCRDASHASAISTDGIASGIYVLRLTDGKGTKIQKIVIE